MIRTGLVGQAYAQAPVAARLRAVAAVAVAIRVRARRRVFRAFMDMSLSKGWKAVTGRRDLAIS